MQWTNLAAVGVGTAGAIIAVTTARSGMNFSDTHDLRRRPAPSTVWNSTPLIVPSGPSLQAAAGSRTCA